MNKALYFVYTFRTVKTVLNSSKQVRNEESREKKRICEPLVSNQELLENKFLRAFSCLARFDFTSSRLPVPQANLISVVVFIWHLKCVCVHCTLVDIRLLRHREKKRVLTHKFVCVEYNVIYYMHTVCVVTILWLYQKVVISVAISMRILIDQLFRLNCIENEFCLIKACLSHTHDHQREVQWQYTSSSYMQISTFQGFTKNQFFKKLIFLKLKKLLKRKKKSLLENQLLAY